MAKYYRVDEDDFDALPFYSDMDEAKEEHSLIIEEQSKDEFIVEQVAQFTRYLLSILQAMPTRGEYNPFNRISKKYPREHTNFFGDFIICPTCHEELYEEEWDANTDDMSPCCPVCEYKFEMENEEE